jgi:protease-4
MRLLRWLWFVLLGLFAVIGAFAVLWIVGLALLWRDFTLPAEPVPESAVLQLDLREPVVEADPIRFPLIGALEQRITMRELVDGIHAAARDERIAGLIARVNGAQLGLAQIEEIRAAIAAFRESGKPAVAYAETFGEGGDGTLDYYLASAFGEIWLQPSGELGVTGLRIEMPFMRTLLADLGIRAEFAAREEYKSAVDIFTRDEMSPAQRSNLEVLLRSWMNQILGDVAAARGIETGEVQDLIDRAPLSAGAAEQAGLIDRRGYRDDAERSIREATDDATLYSFEDYARFVEPPDDAPVVALVYGVGPIHLGEGSGDGLSASDMGADSVVAALRQARETEDAVAVVLRLDSPGGSYVASDAIWREVARTKEAGLPIVVSMGNVAASGGYFVAAPASAIVADRGTVTGSIGVLSGKFVLDGLWADLGIGWDGVGFGANSDMQSPHQPFTEAQWLKLEETLDRIYDDFLQRVADGRGLDRDTVRAVAQGQIWSGSDALEQGLVDEIGGLRKAVSVALEAGGYAPDIEYRLVPVSGDEIEFDGMIGEIEASLRALRQGARLLSRIEAYLDVGGAMSEGPNLRLDPAVETQP